MPRLLVFRVVVFFLSLLLPSILANLGVLEFITATTLGLVLYWLYFGLVFYWLLFKVAPLAFAYMNRNKKSK